MSKVDPEMLKLVAAYTGPITPCRPGRARAPLEHIPVPSKTATFLKEHRADKGVKDVKAARKRQERARAQRERIAQRNAAIRRRIAQVK
jgi:hypothetical protein